MPAQIDPRIRSLRARLGPAVRDGRTDIEAEYRRQLAVVNAELAVAGVVPILTQQERAAIAAVLFSAGDAA